jgi:hypothetical protein
MAAAGVSTAADWWEVSGKTCIAAWQGIGAASQAASYENLANSGTYDLSLGVAPTWSTVTGWTFNGSTQWLETGITGGNSYTGIFRITSSGAQAKAMFGETTGAGAATRFNIYPRYTGDVVYFRSGGNYNQSNTTTSGVFAVTPAYGYIDGTPLGALTAPHSGSTSSTVALGGHKVSGSVSEFWSGSIQAAAIYTATLTDGEISTLTDSINAL